MPDTDRERQTLIQTVFPQQATAVFIAALVVGALVIVLPLVFGSYLSIGGVEAKLLLCLGIALILAAFGGQATVQVGKIIMAGVAGIFFGLFAYLNWTTRNDYVLGSISGIDSAKYEIALTTKDDILGTLNIPGTSVSRARYDFVVFKSDLDVDAVDVVVSIKRSDDNPFSGLERVARVPNFRFERRFATGRRLDWQLVEAIADDDIRFEIRDRSSAEVISAGARQARQIRHAAVAVDTASRFIDAAGRVLPAALIPGAQAQEASSQVATLLTQLKSDDTGLRRGARDALANLAPKDVPVLMAALRKEQDVYRVRLGIVVALSNMVRKGKAQAQALSRQLTDADIALLRKLASDPDRTVQIYAKRFLSDLGDPRAPVG
jgi:hypothetical protein